MRTRHVALLAATLLMAGCMGATQEGGDPSGYSSQRSGKATTSVPSGTATARTSTVSTSTGAATTSTETSTETTGTTETGTGTETGTETGSGTEQPDAPPEGTFRFVEVSGTIMGSGSTIAEPARCDFLSNTYADFQAQSIQVTTGRHDFTADTRIVVYDHASIQDTTGDEAGSCGNAVFQGFSQDGTYFWYRMLEQQRGHVEPIAMVSDGARLMVAGNILAPGTSAILPVSFSWTAPDGSVVDYSGTLTVTYVGDWEVSSVHETDDGQVVGHEAGYGQWMMA